MINIEKQSNKVEQYEALLKQLESLLIQESDALANLSNACSLLHHTFGHHWTGIYRILNEELVLTLFQGPPACTRISKGRGVCGKAWLSGSTINVTNVHEFEDHIACSSLSNSEIVLPLRNNQGEIWGVLDIDSTQFANFDEVDELYLEKFIQYLKL